MRIKIIIFILLMACMVNLNGQSIISYSNGITLRSDQLFDLPRPGSSIIRFDFILTESNGMTIEFHSIGQLDSLPAMDSLLKVVLADLQSLRDNNLDTTINCRIDYYKSPKDVKVRIQTYSPKGDTYQIKGGSISQLKIMQDTLRIRLFTNIPGNQVRKNAISYYYINLYLNNIDELPELIKTGKIVQSIDMLKRDVSKNQNQKKSGRFIYHYYGLYEMKAMRRVYPEKGNSLINYGVVTITLPPTIWTGLHNIKGDWVISMGIGLDLVKHITEYQELHYGLLWEPYFVFTNQYTAEKSSNRNEFLTFRYSNRILSGGFQRKIEYANGFSIGYLIKGRGDWFKPSTYKVSMSAVHGRHWALEPEFFFHKFLKGFTPTVKLLLYFGVE